VTADEKDVVESFVSFLDRILEEIRLIIFDVKLLVFWELARDIFALVKESGSICLRSFNYKAQSELIRLGIEMKATKVEINRAILVESKIVYEKMGSSIILDV
jgi:hypothetical protein